MKPKVRSPLAPSAFPDMSPVPGVILGAAAAGLRYKGRPDLMLAIFREGSEGAALFTRSNMPAAPIEWSRSALEKSEQHIRALVVNSGNANAFTGRYGERAAVKMAHMVADIVPCKSEEVMVASTGVIGQRLDTTPMARPLKRIKEGMSGRLWQDAAHAIMTTDTFPKGASRLAHIDGGTAVISGIAKGSGMIAPDMATMLAFIFTNAPITGDCLQHLIERANGRSFHAITVDGDTSTNDMVLAVATGSGFEGDKISDPDDPRLAYFTPMFEEVMISLAQQIVRDGEGASKFVTISIKGAENGEAARKVAKTIANSPLVKTAIAGADPNWGRIIMAIGKSGERADRDQLSIWIGDQLVTKKGCQSRQYSEAQASTHMQGSHIKIEADLAVGEGQATVWTCDLGHGYIDINADYRS